MRAVAVLLVTLLTCACCDAAKYLIQSGWGLPNTHQLRENLALYESKPFDGIVFQPTVTRDGKPASFWFSIWTLERYDVRDFQQAIEDMKATPFKRLKNNFMLTNVTPGNVDFFDDFSSVVGNFRVAAMIAKQGGVKGIVFDPEPYEKWNPWDYRSAKYRETKTFGEYQAQAFRRGREVMRAINSAFPDICLFLYFGSYMSGTPPGSGGTYYSLLSSFIDGMLDACTPETVIVDGYERTYSNRRPEEFAEGRRLVKEAALKWSRVKEKYRKHISAGFGIWMDNSWPRIGWHTDDFSKNFFAPAEFAYSVHHGLRYSDRYVWIYTETANWWQEGRVPVAYEEALRLAKKRSVPEPPERSLPEYKWPPTSTKTFDGYDDDAAFAEFLKDYRQLLILPKEGWHFSMDPDNWGEKGEWYSTEFDDSSWVLAKIGDWWEPQGFRGYDGWAWYRQEVEFPAELPEKLVFAFGAVDEVAYLYINGKFVGKHDEGAAGWTTAFLIDVSRHLRPGKNLIAIRVYDSALAGGIWKTIRLLTPK